VYDNSLTEYYHCNPRLCRLLIMTMRTSLKLGISYYSRVSFLVLTEMLSRTGFALAEGNVDRQRSTPRQHR
jgi:hypothetical protein